MSVILVLIGASLIVATGFLVAFVWSVRNGQYEDRYTPSVRMLFEEGNDKSKKDLFTKNPGQ
ncbi:MAG: cbb3-type cytochrome oxidase assembly protein CcoS [Ignavibacteria bacterium]|nr:cbb3-type cytochrome oxidase assembly protein CcoS [Ignavibacteria bacterium]